MRRDLSNRRLPLPSISVCLSILRFYQCLPTYPPIACPWKISEKNLTSLCLLFLSLFAQVCSVSINVCRRIRLSIVEKKDTFENRQWRKVNQIKPESVSRLSLASISVWICLSSISINVCFASTPCQLLEPRKPLSLGYSYFAKLGLQLPLAE